LPAWEVGGLGRLVLLGVQGTIGTKRLAVLLEHVGVEKVALQWVIKVEDGQKKAPQGGRGVDGVLSSCVRRTKVWIIGTWEESGSKTSAWMVVQAGAWLRLFPARAGWWSGVVRLGETVRSGNDNLEIITVLTVVGGRSTVNSGSPKSTLVVSDGGWFGAVGSWV